MPEIEIKKLDVLSVAKVGAIIGLIWGIIYGIIGAGGAGVMFAEMPLMAGAGAALMFVLGIVGGLIWGFIGGALTAFFYNIAAGWVGGIEFKH